MKRQSTGLMLAGLILITQIAGGQGSLTPPGAPGATMKTLAQVEPRTAITSAPYTITQPGSYYLATNLTNTVTIAADNVTLDLMGFSIQPYLEAIDFPSSQSNIVIRNGMLKNASTALDGRTIEDGHCLFEGLQICGGNIGIYAGSGCTIRDCEIWASGMYGILVARGTNSAVENCRIVRNTGVGLEAAGGVRIVGNTIAYNTGAGLS